MWTTTTRVYGFVGGIIGVLLLAGGIYIAFQGHSCVEEYQTMSGQVVRSLSVTQQHQFEQCKNYRLWGAIAAVVGLVIAGGSGGSDQDQVH